MTNRRTGGPGPLLGLALLLWALGPAGAGAAATPPNFSLQVSPTRFVIEPSAIGQSHVFKVSNDGRLPLEVVVEKADFTSTRQGAMVLAPRSAYSAVDWLATNTNRFRLAPHTSQLVTFRITAPSGPEPGDHQAALVFMVPAADQGPNIRLNRGIGTPIYITVPGRTDATTKVTGLRAPGFAVRGPVRLTATLTDSGNVHRDFRGSGALRADAHGTTLNFPDFTILRDSTRETTVAWRDPPLFCVCHATVAMNGPGGPSQRKVEIVIVPLVPIGILLGLLAALGLLAWYLRRRRRVRPGHVA